MRSMGTRLPVSVTIGLGLVVLAAACGTNATAGSAPAAAPSGAATVTARTVNGASVLVDRAGTTLYTNDQDKAGKPQCVSSDCTKIWVPLTLASGKATAGPGVTGTVATVRRPDGTNQVTLDGKPLYTFSFDHTPGQVTGNGAQDSFAGTAFTWHSAAAGAQAPAAPPANGIPGYRDPRSAGSRLDIVHSAGHHRRHDRTVAPRRPRLRRPGRAGSLLLHAARPADHLPQPRLGRRRRR